LGGGEAKKGRDFAPRELINFYKIILESKYIKGKEKSGEGKEEGNVCRFTFYLPIFDSVLLKRRKKGEIEKKKGKKRCDPL